MWSCLRKFSMLSWVTLAGWMWCLNGVVLCGQAEGVIADGEQDVVALHPLLPADDVHGGEGPGVAHVEPLAGGIGKLDQAEELLPSLVPRDGGEGLLLQPLLLPLFLNAGKIVFHILLLIPVNGFLCSIYFCRGAPPGGLSCFYGAIHLLYVAKIL